jgi:peroxiredoxin Q/BCP
MLEAYMIQENSPAPDFVLENQDGQKIRLSDFRGQNIVLYFYPKDDTPGCTKEACSLRDGIQELESKQTIVLGVSPDSAASHTAFRSKFNLPFNLLCDPEHKVLEEYGAWGEKNMYGKITIGVLRSTVIIDTKGIIKKIIRKVDTENHASQVLPFIG